VSSDIELTYNEIIGSTKTAGQFQWQILAGFVIQFTHKANELVMLGFNNLKIFITV
jgi:hypothetical protein